MKKPFSYWLKVQKYHYDIFLGSLSPWARTKVLKKKFLGLLDARRPASLEIGLTYRCQMACVHCGVHGQQRKGGQELSFEELKAAIDQAGRLGVYLIIFSGGEPLLRSDVVSLVGYSSRRGFIPAISTNGWEMTADMARELKIQGLAFANISMDSARPVLHDQRRDRAGSFEKARIAVDICLREKIKVIVSTYATRENIQNGDLEDLIDLARRAGAHGVRILLSVPSGRWLKAGAFGLTADEKDRLRSLLDPLFVYVEGVRNKFTECQALRRKLLYLSPYGEVQPCSFVPVYFGDIRQESLARIWGRMRSHEFFRRFDPGDCVMRDPRFAESYLGAPEGESLVLPQKI